jgi:hypothetical protein
MEVKIITDISVEPVTVAEARTYLRITTTAQDTLIGELITDARERLEKFTNLSFGAKTLKCRWDVLDGWAEIPYQPNAVVSACINDAGDTLSYDTKGLEYKYLWCVNSTGVTITYTAGFTTLPKALKVAILKEVATSYENRENYYIEGTFNELSNDAKRMAQSYSRNTFLGI